MNFERLLAEHEFARIIERVKNFDLFEFVRFDKANKIELRIAGYHCDNGIWQDNYLVSISGSKKHGGWYGFSSPYQRAKFLKLSYDDIAKMFACYGYQKADITQLNMFAVI